MQVKGEAKGCPQHGEMTCRGWCDWEQGFPIEALYAAGWRRGYEIRFFHRRERTSSELKPTALAYVVKPPPPPPPEVREAQEYSQWIQEALADLNRQFTADVPEAR